MGKGKGNPEFWAAVVEPGRILLKPTVFSSGGKKEACFGAAKLPIKHNLSFGVISRAIEPTVVLKIFKPIVMSKKVDFVSLRAMSEADLRARISEDELLSRN